MCNNFKVLTDQTKSEAFAEKMMTILNYGSLNLMISIGYRTGLFDVMDNLPPANSEEIAKESGLNERYVREWLAALYTGGIIEYNPKDATYHLPGEHAVWLTRRSTPNNFAVTTQWLGLLGSVEDEVVECFKNGGGVPYESFHRFNEVMADESHQNVVAPLFDIILPIVPGLIQRLQSGIDVLDLGCGSGLVLKELAKAYPNSKFTGYDFLNEAVVDANKSVQDLGLTNIKFLKKDVAKIDDVKKYDLITTFDAIHDQADPDAVLKNIFCALKDDGTYFMQDIKGSSHVHKNIDHPIAPLLYTTSTMHCMTVSLAQGGKGLGAMWGKELACEMLKNAGFTKIDVKELSHDPINYYYIINK